MKYSDILPDVLLGKWIKPNNGCPWIRMIEDGSFEWENGDIANVTREQFNQDTWEVKPYEPEEFYVWGFTNINGDSILTQEKTELSDFGTHEHVMYFDDHSFPKDRPQKYKLIPVDEEQKVYSYKLSIEPREYTGTAVLVENAMGGESRITLSVDGAIRDTCGSKFKLIPIEDITVQNQHEYIQGNEGFDMSDKKPMKFKEWVNVAFGPGCFDERENEYNNMYLSWDAALEQDKIRRGEKS